MSEAMKKFWELLERSVIVQSALTLLLVSTCVYIWLCDRILPDQLSYMTTTVVGFWFGTKVQSEANRAQIEAVRRQILDNQSR